MSDPRFFAASVSFRLKHHEPSTATAYLHIEAIAARNDARHENAQAEVLQRRHQRGQAAACSGGQGCSRLVASEANALLRCHQAVVVHGGAKGKCTPGQRDLLHSSLCG